MKKEPMQSKYITKFQRINNKEARKNYRLNGSRVLIEILPQPELKSAGGLLLTAPSEIVRAGVEHMKPILAIILLTGEGYFDSNGDDVPMSVEPGNIVMVNDLALRALSTFPGLGDYSANSIALTDESSIQMQWPNLDAYKAYEALLNDQN